jgi:DNA-binding beta-propeller fold protein YncE
MLRRMLVVASLIAGAGVADAAAATPGLVQKPGLAGCFQAAGRGPCRGVRAMTYPQVVTASPDGRDVYVGAEFSKSIAVFDRAADGSLSQRADTGGCISDGGAGGCRPGRGIGFAIFGGPYGLAFSPDGANLYAASYGSAVAVLDRSADGSLTQRAGLAACVSDAGNEGCADGRALSFVRDVAVSPDGANVYVAAEQSDAVAVFDRAADGGLTQKAGTAGCISSSDASCAAGRALDETQSVTVSPDGASVYVASLQEGVAIFDRAADGSLTQKPGTAGCVNETGAGGCADGTGAAPYDVAVSADGRSVYVGIARGVLVFDRAADGALTQKAGTAGCITSIGSDPCARGVALGSVQSVAVSKDGATVLAAAAIDSAVAVFDRAADGSLAQKPGITGCVSEDGGQCTDATGLRGAKAVTLSPDGANAYVAGSDDDLAIFDRVPVAAPPPPAGPVLRPQPGCPPGGVQAAGTDGVDALVGAARRDVLFGLADTDLLRGLAGRDCLYGGDGDDALLGGSGADRLFGGPGDDRLDGEDGRDGLRGADAGRNTNGDYLSGGAGRDRLADRRGDATLTGGAGSDRIDARDASSRDRRRRDVVRCGAGRDTALVDTADSVSADCERVVRRPIPQRPR